MIIDAMVARENFYKINEDTLRKYYKTVYGKTVDVETERPSFRSRILIYPHIGSIMTRVPDKRILKYFLNEYNLRNRPVKHILAKIYVICNFFSLGLLAGRALSLSDESVFDSSTAIIPANRKLRIYYFRKGYVDAIVKNTFTHKYFDNELSFRLRNTCDFIPPILAHGDDWYREEILEGQPLARVTDDALYQKSVGDVITYIGMLAEKTLEYSDVSDYAGALYAGIEKDLLKAKERKKIRSFDTITQIAEAAYKKAARLEAPVPVVVSHGDLQSGNVWIDTEKEKTYIIDWETHEKRSIWYDCATILLSTRRAGQLKAMMDGCETEAVKEAVLKNDKRKDYDMQAVMGIITLEDIKFYLDDMLELPLDFGGDIFDRIAGELDRMGWRSNNG